MGWVESAYRILVASSDALLLRNQGDLWDSGKVNSDKSIQVSYAGKQLISGQPVCWKVQVWDGLWRHFQLEYARTMVNGPVGGERLESEMDRAQWRRGEGAAVGRSAVDWHRKRHSWHGLFPSDV